MMQKNLKFNFLNDKLVTPKIFRNDKFEKLNSIGSNVILKI